MEMKSIHLWCSQKDELVALKKTRKCRTKRLKGAGQKPSKLDMEEALYSWIVGLRSHVLRVSHSMIRVQQGHYLPMTVSKPACDGPACSFSACSSTVLTRSLLQQDSFVPRANSVRLQHNKYVCQLFGRWFRNPPKKNRH